MKENILEQASQCFGKLAAQMDYETAALDYVEIDLDGQIMEIPAIIVKGRPEDILVYSTVRTQLIAVDTPECPVVALGVEFPYQESSLAGWYFTWLPIHNDHQRSDPTGPNIKWPNFRHTSPRFISSPNSGYVESALSNRN